MKVIVTGAAGFIGSHVVERFLGRGHEVVGFDNLSRPGNLNNLAVLHSLSGAFTFLHGDIRCASDVARLFREHSGAGLVIHAAGQVAVTTSVSDPHFDFEANLLGTFHVLDETRRTAPDAIFLFASTNKVYGQLDHLLVNEMPTRYGYQNSLSGVGEDTPVDFHSPYGCSKGGAEQYVRDYHRIYGLRTVAFRQSCIYGTRQYGMEDQGWVAWFTIAATLGLPVTIFGDGKQVRDLLWVSDLIDLYERAVANIDVAAGQIYNAGGGASNTLSLLELVKILQSHLGRRIEVSHSSWRPGDQKIFIANCAKASAELGWAPRVAPETGIGMLLDWVRRSEHQFPAGGGGVKTVAMAH